MKIKETPTVLVVGGNGFVGQAVVAGLQNHGGYTIQVTVRSPMVFPMVNAVHCGLDLAADTDWSTALSGVDCVIVCAARVHQMRDHAKDPLAEFRAVNTEGTLALARQAVAAGVKRLIFLSSIGVNGAQTTDHPYTASDAPHPHSPYARSKYEAEQGLLALARDSGLEVVILRPPLVYGPNAPGNFARLLSWLRRGVPLPLGAVKNLRSFVFLGNLVDLILCCVRHPAAAQQIFLVSDGHDLSTTELLQKIGTALGKVPLLIPVPVSFLKGILIVLGKKGLSQQLLSSLQVDMTATKQILDWSPPFDVDTALEMTVSSSD